ncbi:hypothetical protein [Portibacter lacus]|uniref:Lipoprotein n=1 Tax=Portibacter lacus TaxID=1099794 RepID=A0AA37SLR4_9BACT|nr:hypothetical protein [Portibacter lacus]GLR15889.1 hypothetical protein GCM10007940_05040 [Portibacter lacus]
MKRIIVILSFVLIAIASCIKTNLEDISNKSIPNYSETLNSTELSATTQSNIIALDDNNFITAIQDQNNNIQIIKITQEFLNDNWLLTSQTLLEVGQGNLAFFNTLENEYLIGYTSSRGYILQVIDENINLSYMINDIESFIDTAYNNIDSIHFMNFSYATEKQEVLLGGKLFSQGTSYSCLLSMDKTANLLWVKTYFENSTISNVLSIENDNFLLLNTNEEGTELIRDDVTSNSYAKFDLTNDTLFFGSQVFSSGNSVFLTGVHNDIGRTIEVNLQSNTAFVNEIDLYPVKDLKAVFLSRNNFVTAGIQVEGEIQSQFSSELGSVGSLWCHRYIDEYYEKVLDIIEMPGKGVLVSAIVERDGKYYLHLTRIDEEGATFINEYSENCI